MYSTLAACCFAFVAGLIDSIAGGGGLVQVPAQLLTFPNMSVVNILATNKMAGTAGTFTSALRYSTSSQINWHTVLPAAGAGFVSSVLGAWTASLISNDLFRPMLITLLAIVAIYTGSNKNLGAEHTPKLNDTTERYYAIVVGTVVGFWDGLVGPGAGSFLMVIFIGLFGYSSLAAAGAARIINFATNLSALIYFVAAGHGILAVGLPMAVCNASGAAIGSRLAIKHGSRFIRNMLLLMVLALLTKVLLTR